MFKIHRLGQPLPQSSEPDAGDNAPPDPQPSTTDATDGGAAPPAPTGWSATALTLPARIAKVTSGTQDALSKYQHLVAATESGMAEDATKILSELGPVKELSPVELKSLYASASSAAARRAAKDVLAKGVRDVDELPLVASKALGAGTRAATRVASETLEATQAAKLGGLIADSPGGKAALAAAGRIAFKAGWLGHVVPFMGGAVTSWDAKQAVQTLRDPNATLTQKVAGAVTVLADATTFIPVPAVSLIGAALSIPTSFLRDNPHPLTALGDLIGSGNQAHAVAH